MSCRVLLHTRNQPTLPDNSGYTFIFDTTRWEDSVKGVLGKAAAVTTAGDDRGKFAGVITELLIGCTDQDVTLYRVILDGAGAWKTYATTTITAGADSQQIIWEPGSGDWMLYVAAGATKPATLFTDLTILKE